MDLSSFVNLKTVNSIMYNLITTKNFIAHFLTGTLLVHIVITFIRIIRTEHKIVYKIIFFIFLPRQHCVLHTSCLMFEPKQSFPPQEGVGLSHVLVDVRIPPPHVLEHGPGIQELHPP